MCHDGGTARSWAAPGSAVLCSVPEHPQRVLELGLSALLGPQQHHAAQPRPWERCAKRPCTHRERCRGSERCWVSAPQVPRRLLAGQEGPGCASQNSLQAAALPWGCSGLPRGSSGREGGWELAQGGTGRSPHTFPSPPALPPALQQLQGLRQVQSQLARAEREGVQPRGERECPGAPPGWQHPLPHPTPPRPPPRRAQPFAEPISPNSWSYWWPTHRGAAPAGFGVSLPRGVLQPCVAQLRFGRGGGALPSPSIPLPDPRG